MTGVRARRARSVVAAVALVAGVRVVVADGFEPAAAPLPPEAAGRCPDRGRGGADTPAVSGAWAAESLSWAEVSPDGPIRPASLLRSRSRRVGVRVTAVLRAAPGAGVAAVTEVEMPDDAAEQLLAETRAGAGLVLALDPDRYTEHVAALRPDGSVVFLDGCGVHGTTALARFAAERAAAGDRRPAPDLLRSILRAPDGRDGRAFARSVSPAPPAWDELPPDQRHVGNGASPPAPPRVMRTLTEVLVELRLPPAWRSFEGMVCPRLSVGWNAECAGFGASPGGVVTFHSMIRPGEGLALWLRLDDGTPVGVIGRVPPRRVRAGDTIVVRADPAVTTFGQLAEVARTSHGALTV